MHRKKRKNRRNRKRNAYKKGSKLIHNIVFFCAFLLMLLGVTYGSFRLFSKAEEPQVEKVAEGNQKETVVQELVIEQQVVKSERETDIRKVQNTATAERHKVNGLAICMYHFVYDKNNPPAGVDSNFIEASALREQFQYLVDNEYYFPTWEEVRQYIDGEVLLPEKSVVLTFDDAAQSFLDMAIPIAEEVGVPITSFIITSYDGPNKVETYASPYVSYQSHTHDMHKPGGNIGRGGIFTAMPEDAAVADLKTSIEIAGNGEALAYPFGDYNDTSVQATQNAGFLCAVTTEAGRVYPGNDPYRLPRVRISEGQSLSSFISSVE